MHSVIKKIGVLFFSVALLLSCSKIPPTNNTISCQFTDTVGQPLTKDQSVQYTAGTTGTGGSISTLTYLDSAGNTTVQNPVLPFITHVNLKKNTRANISAKGTANLGGQLLIYITADSIQTGNGCNN